MIATAELAAPATSAELVNEITSVEMPRAAITAAVQTSATPSGEPQEAPMSSVVATTRTVIASMPCTKPPRSLPPSTVHGFTGPARIRPSVPWRRSSNRLTRPICAEKNRNRMAIDAEK